MDTKIKDRVVLVTGASGGIGAAIARQFAEEGARVILHYRSNAEAAKQLQGEIGAKRSLLVKADLAQEDQVIDAIARARTWGGQLDTLIANAGSWENRDVPLHRMSLQQWQRTHAAVLTSAFLCLREFLKIVASQKRGNAVLIASTAAIFGEAGHADYAAAKAAMAFGLTRSLKNEIARIAPGTSTYCGGRINCVCPGWTVVPRTAGQLRHLATLRRVLATRALRRVARPEDIANAVVFLASDHLARHLTGQILAVAGGMEGRLLWEPSEIDPTLALG
jgi:3-oxoacyl-[acyl-carrier protein] reductase